MEIKAKTSPDMVMFYLIMDLSRYLEEERAFSFSMAG
jgi:hypothetical protein